MLNTFALAGDWNQTLYYIAIKAGLYKKAAQVLINYALPHKITKQRSTNKNNGRNKKEGIHNNRPTTTERTKNNQINNLEMKESTGWLSYYKFHVAKAVTFRKKDRDNIYHIKAKTMLKKNIIKSSIRTWFYTNWFIWKAKYFIY